MGVVHEIMALIASNIIVAVLALAGTLGGAFLANKKSTAVIAYRLEQLEKKVEKHNNVVERLYKLEGEVKEIERRMS